MWSNSSKNDTHSPGLFVAVVKDFVGQRLNCVVNSLKSGVVVGIEIVFVFSLQGHGKPQ